MEEPRQSKPNWNRWEIDRIRYRLKKPPAPIRDIRPIGDILKNVMEDLEAPKDENLLLLRAAWPEIAGAQIAKHSQPAVLQGFVLQIDVDHPGWMPEIERLKRALLQKLQAKYRELRIRKLHFRLIHR